MRKFICAVLTAVMAVTALANLTACGDYEDYDPNNFMTAEQALAEGTPYRIVREPVTIKIFVPKSDSNPNYDTMRMFTELSRETNLNFQFIEAASDQYSTMRNATWQDRDGDDFPDLFLFSNETSEIVQYSKFGALTPFNEPNYEKEGVAIGSLIDNYMPTFKTLLDSNFSKLDKDYYKDFYKDGVMPKPIEGTALNTPKTAREIITLSDGRIYSVPSVNSVPRDLTTKFYLNQKWIDELNEGELRDDPLPNAGDIKTIEELDRVLRAFKEYNASGAQSGETIPLITDNLNDLRNYVLSAFGYVSNTIEINQAGDGFVYVPKEEAYRKYLQIMRDWYTDGILYNATAFSSDVSIIRQKGAAGLLGSFCAAAAYLIVGENKGEQGQDWYTTAGPFTSEYYTGKAVQYSRPMICPDGAVIPSTTYYAREIARLLDIMYSKLGVSLSAFGQENVDWYWVEKDVAWAKKIPSSWTKTEEDYRATLTPNVGLGVALYNSYDFVGKEVSPSAGEVCVTDKLNKLAERYMPYLKEPMPAYIKLASMEDYNTENKIGVTLMAKVKEYEYMFINKNGGKDPYNDSDWNAYVNDLVNYRCNDWLALYQNAL